MSENSKIEWTDHTFNPWIGCTRVSPGCDHCYAAVSTPARAMGIQWGAGEQRRRTAPSTWTMPKRWDAKHDAFFAQYGRRQRVFCASLADVFDNSVDPAWRADLFDLIRTTPNLDWLLLTKRIGNVRAMLEEVYRYGMEDHFDMPAVEWIQAWLEGSPPANVWLGATIVNQEEADRDIPKLLAVPAAKRFLSIEPLLRPLSLRWLAAWPEHAPAHALKRGADTNHLDGLRRLDWVIVGGESGSGARPMHPAWARSLRDECAEAGVPFFFKQHGEWAPTTSANYAISAAENRHGNAPGVAMLANGNVCCLDSGPSKPLEYVDRIAFRHWDKTGEGDYQWLHRVGKRAAGRELDGVIHDGFPGVPL